MEAKMFARRVWLCSVFKTLQFEIVPQGREWACSYSSAGRAGQWLRVCKKPGEGRGLGKTPTADPAVAAGTVSGYPDSESGRLAFLEIPPSWYPKTLSKFLLCLHKPERILFATKSLDWCYHKMKCYDWKVQIGPLQRAKTSGFNSRAVLPTAYWI